MVDKDNSRIIKKYENRRLYDTEENRYVALDDLKILVANAIPFQVIESKSGADITRSILLQIIFEQEKKGDTILSTDLLKKIIQFYGNTLQAFVGTYLEKSIDVFSSQQKVFHDQMEQMIKSTPKNIFTEMSERNLEVWQQMQNNFMQAFGSMTEEDKESQKDSNDKDK